MSRSLHCLPLKKNLFFTMYIKDKYCYSQSDNLEMTSSCPKEVWIYSFLDQVWHKLAVFIFFHKAAPLPCNPSFDSPQFGATALWIQGLLWVTAFQGQQSWRWHWGENIFLKSFTEDASFRARQSLAFFVHLRGTWESVVIVILPFLFHFYHLPENLMLQIQF